VLPARANPFRADRIEALRFRFVDHDWSTVFTRFVANGRRGVLVGPHGSGKTTLREELERQLRSDGYCVRALVFGDDRRVNWAELSACLDGADQRTVLSLDGLDRIGAVTWWRLQRATRTLGGLLATSHVRGRLPLLHHHRTDSALLMKLVGELVSPTTVELLRERCATLFQQHHGDIRACLRAMYDHVADSATLTTPVQTGRFSDARV
jgi:energy-coupling factor transporter ATP-binding protein EcfA2